MTFAEFRTPREVPDAAAPGRSRVPFRVVLIALACVQSFADAADPPPAPRKSLIEFGWDEPDTSFLRSRIAQFEASPFDGCVLHIVSKSADGKPGNPTWESWGTRPFGLAEFAQAADDLGAIRASRFASNFLRLNVTPGKLDWFDDYSAVVGNARAMATVARAGACRGILLDTEAYEGQLFHYPSQKHAGTKSWAEYAARARARGREVMNALQDGFPGLTVLLTFGHTLPWDESRRKGGAPLERCQNGLLAPLLDGMVDAARDGARIVDGYEQSYGYRTPERFAGARRDMTEGVLPIVADAGRYRDVVRPGFGLWLDYDWRKNGWDAADPSRNYFTPASFEASVRLALEHADEFVWIYAETPRWWTPDGRPIKLPDPYTSALRRAKPRP